MPDLDLIKQAEQVCGTGARLPRAAPAIPTAGSVCRDHGNRVALLRLASSGVAGYVTSRPRSRIGALCVIQPLETGSTPVAAMIGAVSRLIRPEASVMARGRPSISASSPRSASTRPATGPSLSDRCSISAPPFEPMPVRSCSSTPAPYAPSLHPRTLHQGPAPHLAPRLDPRPQRSMKGRAVLDAIVISGPPIVKIVAFCNGGLDFSVQLRPQALRPSSSAA
jgi:hypothetical protein